MKFWSSKPENAKYTYSNLTYVGGLVHTSNSIDVSDFNKLAKETETFLQKGQDLEATQYAGRLAIEYGISGLMIFIDTRIKILSKESSKNEIIEKEVIHLLAYLYFAQNMLLDKKEAKALRSMDDVYFDDEYKTESYWAEREKKLILLAGQNFDIFKTEAKDIADVIIMDCCEEVRKANSLSA